MSAFPPSRLLVFLPSSLPTF